MRPSSFQVDCPWRTKVTLLGVDTLGNAQTAPRHPRARGADCRDEDSSKRFRREATYETRAGATVCRATDIAPCIARSRWTTTDEVPKNSRRTPASRGVWRGIFVKRRFVALELLQELPRRVATTRDASSERAVESARPPGVREINASLERVAHDDPRVVTPGAAEFSQTGRRSRCRIPAKSRPWLRNT